MKTISKKSVLIWQIKYTISIILAAFLNGSLFIFSFYMALFMELLIAMIYIFLIFYYIPKKFETTQYKFETTQYKFESEKFTLTKGVIFSKKIYIFTSSIQYVELKQALFEKWLKISSVIFHTTATRIPILYLDENEANNLKDSILKNSANK